jgi:predicted hotdog family 3-hydroxylacyl-ACP dehydratase
MFPISGEMLAGLIPQKQPFTFLNSLEEVSETTCTTKFKAEAGNVLCDNGKLNPAGLLENIAQTSGCKLGYENFLKGKSNTLGFIGEVSEFSYNRLPAIEEELTTTVTIEKKVFDVLIISGKVKIGNEEIAQCRMKVFIAAEEGAGN